MLLTFRTIGNKLYQIEASPSDTIRSVKERLASANAYDLTKMRLIFKAKVLPDSRTLAELGIDGSGFIVLHAVPVSAAAPAKAPSQPQNAPPAAAPEPCPPAPPPAPVGPSIDPLPCLPRFSAPAPPGFPQKIASLTSMGFSKGDCDAALRASHGNVDRAADFLLSGHIPDLPQLLSISDVPISDSDDEDTPRTKRRRMRRPGCAASPAFATL